MIKQTVSVHDFRQTDVRRSQGHSASNIGKLRSIDSAPKWASGSLKANVKDVPIDHPSSQATLENNCNIRKQLQNSPVNLNNDPALQDQQENALSICVRG